METQIKKNIEGYDLLERIGAGGFGAVYRAYQSTVGREVAVKIILPAYANKPEFIRRFEIEAQLVARLEHLHIVPLYDFWRDPEGAYIVMRWLRGGSLRAALKNGAFDLEPASLLLDQTAAGLATAHEQQIVHRDLKPSNILLDEDGNAYLADFGIARDLGNGRGINSQSGDGITGSPEYMSPEQARGQEATPQSDIYGLGVTLHEMLTGQHPFAGQSSVEKLFKHINEPLPTIELPNSKATAEVVFDINEIIQKATAKNPKHRYQDALALAAAFRDAAGLSGNGQTDELVETLTRREQEILQLIIDGQTNKQIAGALFVELSTIKWHVNRLYKKLGVRSRVQAIVRARELNLIVAADEFELETDDGIQTEISLVLPEPVNPYKGLRAFEPADNRDFYGREALVESLLARLATLPRSGGGIKGEGRFLAIVGPSGSGKSSLVKAGLIPALWSGQIEGAEKWFIVDMSPGARPLDELEIALTRIAAEQAGNIRNHLDRDAHGLARAASLILPKDDSELVVVVDQFEELYTLVEEDAVRNHFMDLIHGAVEDSNSRVRVIITLRADFYDRPLQYPAFGNLVRNHLETLLPLSAEELERAIVNPSHQVGVTFENGLVATIIEEVNYRPGALPLLQYALTELFDQRQERLLTADAYTAIGGAAGALARRAEELYQEQGNDEREAIRHMFLRLVSAGSPVGDSGSTKAGGFDGATPADTRKRVPRSELLSASGDPDRLDEIIDTYADYRLLSLDHNPATRQPTVEVAHEAILREWDRLRGWLEESRADLALHRQLIRATREWIESGSDDSFLLRGARLSSFESWVDDSQWVLTEKEQAYLDSSIALRAKRALAEQERQEQEARLEQRASRRLKALVVVMAVALVVAIGLTIAAINFARQAEEQRRLATARELASAAVTNLDLDPERSVLLALEAADTTYLVDGTVLPEVEDALHQAVQADRVQLTIPMEGAPAYSPDGEMLAIGGEDGSLAIWDAATGQRIHRLSGHLGLISTIAFSRNGRILVTSSLDSTVNFWDPSSGRLIGTILASEEVGGFAISRDSTQVATHQSGAIRLWDIAQILDGLSEESRPVELREPTLVIETPGFSSGVAFGLGGRIAGIVPGLSVFVWDTRSGEQLLEIPGAGDSAGIAFNISGNRIAAGSSDAGASIWDAETGEEIRSFHEPSPLADVHFSRKGDLLVTGAKDGTAALWDTRTGRQVIRIPGRSDGFNFIALSPDGQQLATGSDNRSTRIWDLRPSAGGEILAVAAHEGEVYDAVYSPDGTKMASTGEDGTVNLWDPATGEQLLSLPGRTDFVFFPAFSPDGRQLAAANQDGGVSIWDANSGQELMALRGDAQAYTAVTFSPDGSRLAAAGGLAGEVNIWDAATGENLVAFRNDAEIIRLVYDLGGGRIWTYDWDGFATSWDAVTGEAFALGPESATDRVCDTALWDAELTQDGQLWAAAGFDGLAHVYKAEGAPIDEPGYSRVYSLDGHRGNLTGTAFNSDGSILATSSFDGTVKLWDMSDGQELLTLTDQPLSLGGVDFSPDGRTLVTAGADGMARFFIVSVESIDELMVTARSGLSRDLTHVECDRYLHTSICTEE